MDAAVVKLDALTDSVWSAAENHNLWLVGMDRILVRRVVGRVVVSAVGRAADMDAFPCLLHAKRNTPAADGFLWNFEELAQILVGKSVFLGRN